MEQLERPEIAIFIAILCILGVFLWLFVLIFIRRKNKLIANQVASKQAFESELAKTQVEIQEHTLRNISWELHDNIGQLLTLAKIQVQNAQDSPELLDEAIDGIGDALKELRMLSKHINPQTIKALSLLETVTAETDRFNRLGVLQATIATHGLVVSLTQEIELLLFRILQEFFTNTIKYAKATQLEVVLIYLDNGIHIKARDNGIGFNPAQVTLGLGLQNMKHRASLIGAQFNLESKPGVGTSLDLIYMNTKA